MIDVNSNCSRVDAVKAAATQLKLQSTATSSATKAAGHSPAPAGADATRKVQSDLQNLDTQVKADNAQKAELALAVTKKDAAAAQTTGNPQSDGTQIFRGLDVYA